MAAGKRTVRKVCQKCGIVFLARRAEVNRANIKYCSRQCNWRAARKVVLRTCAWCKKVYESIASNKKSRFCCRPCKNAFATKPNKVTFRMRCLDHYGNVCACCGEHERKFLTIDHANNDGAEHRKELKGMALDRWLVNNDFPPGFQLLCWNCNMAKALYGECPHTGARMLSLVI